MKKIKIKILINNIIIFQMKKKKMKIMKKMKLKIIKKF